ncbi:MAG: hypothetical protein PHN64_04625 [Desulfovibrionaceae bacterium]|nr:hypothetical protein [Desulfovibrionaceae bacterium]
MFNFKNLAKEFETIVDQDKNRYENILIMFEMFCIKHAINDEAKRKCFTQKLDAEHKQLLRHKVTEKFDGILREQKCPNDVLKENELRKITRAYGINPIIHP